MCRISPNHLAIGIDRVRFVESPESQLFKNRYPRKNEPFQTAGGAIQRADYAVTARPHALAKRALDDIR